MRPTRARLVLFAALGTLASAARASTRIPVPLHLALHRAGIVATIRVDSLRAGIPERASASRDPRLPAMAADMDDTLFGTFMEVLKSDAGRLPIYRAVLARENEWPGKIGDLIRDAGRFDAELSPSAFHELARMGPRAASAHAALLGLIPNAALAGRLADVGFGLWATRLSADSLRAAMQEALDRYGPSRNKDVPGLLAMLGPGSLPRLAEYATSDPDEWVRHSVVLALCDPSIKGPAAMAVAKRVASGEKADFVRHGARKLLQECYGGPPAD